MESPRLNPKREDVLSKLQSVPAFKDVKSPTLFERFILEVLPKIELQSTSQAILKSFSRKDVTALEIAGILKKKSLLRTAAF